MPKACRNLDVSGRHTRQTHFHLRKGDTQPCPRFLHSRRQKPKPVSAGHSVIDLKDRVILVDPYPQAHLLHEVLELLDAAEPLGDEVKSNGGASSRQQSWQKPVKSAAFGTAPASRTK